MAMKASAPSEGVQAVVRQVQTLGISVGAGAEQHHFTLGWDRQQRIEIIREDAAVRLEWPAGGAFSLRVGAHVPKWFHPTDAETAR
jgi:hypothetical protein